MQLVSDKPRIVVQRLLADGSLDTSFGTGGQISTLVGAHESSANAIVAMDDGRFVIGGGTGGGGMIRDWLILRYNANGTLDNSFNGVGYIIQPGDYISEVTSLAIQQDGRIVVGGGNYGAPLIRRYTSAGVLDVTFGAGGVTGLGGGAGNVSDLALQPWDERIVVTAPWQVSGPSDVATTWRLRTDGTFDTSYGTNGRSSLDLSAGNDKLEALTITTDGRIIGAGTSFPDANSRFTLTRVGGPTLGDFAAGSRDWTNGADMFGACLRAVGGAGVAATWNSNATCPMTAGTHWNPVPPTSGSAGATIATSSIATTANATTALRFGVRIPASQRPGDYYAPVVFEVVAP
jgi:uncharacterized delta-60 repeat protein